MVQILLPAPRGLPGRRAYQHSHQSGIRRIAPKLFGSHGQRPWFNWHGYPDHRHGQHLRPPHQL